MGGVLTTKREYVTDPDIYEVGGEVTHPVSGIAGTVTDAYRWTGGRIITVDYQDGSRRQYDMRPTHAEFGDDVAAEVRKLHIRAEAKRRYDQDRAGMPEPFDAGTLDQILARPPAPVARVKDLIPWEAGTLIVAQRKTGKTTMALNLARSLLAGEDFLGEFPVVPVDRNVTVLNYEVSAAQVARWAADVGFDQPERLQLVNLRGRRNPLADPEGRAALARQIRDHDTETLIVDPFSRAFTGTNPNDSGEVAAYLGDLDTFTRAEAGATDLVLTTHAGWNGERSRGASALEDWADSLITLVRDDDTGQRYMRALGRDVDLDERELAFDGRRLFLSGGGSRRQAKSEAKQREQEQAVLDVLAEQDQPPSTSDIERLIKDRGVGFQRGDVSRACHRLQAKGLATFEPGKQGRKLWSRVVMRRVV